MLLSQPSIDSLISSVASSSDPISKDLFDQYAKSLRRGVGSVFADGSFTDLHAQLDANVSRFAAYKAYVATQRIRQAVSGNGDIEDGRIEVNKFNRWLAAEYNTAVARSRTAKQWSEWDSSEERSLFPNIMWLPSRSATLREQHIPFYNRVWAKDDPFWNHNQPGTLWNCKCDWQQTDEPVTPNNPNKTVRNQGLEGNPAKTGQIFSDNASYIENAPEGAPKTITHTIRDFYREQHKSDRKTVETGIGNILVDKITHIEVSKGAKSDKSFFYKLQITEDFSHFADKLVLIDENEPIDLSHNNHRSIFYQRKKLFSKMEKYRLHSGGFDFEIKIGVFKDGSKNLYCITEPI